MTRRRLFLAGLGASMVAPGAALAWPDRPLRIIVGFQAGGGSDVIARLASERLRAPLGGATIVVENKPGAAGSLAADMVLGAHDGHTLLVLSDSLLTASLTNRRVHFQPLRDFKPVSLLAEGTIVVVANEHAPFRDFASFVAYVRANPGKLNYVTAGLGGQQHLTAECIAATLKLDMIHVPMRGGSQATQDLLGGQVDAGVLGIGPTLPHIRAGRLVPLAVSVAARLPQLPEVPTLGEVGLPGFAVGQWFGLAVPADAPDEVVTRLANAVGQALDDDTMRRRYDDVGFTAHPSSPAEFVDKIRTEETRWRKLIAERGLKLD
ncbi:MAG: Bug family tripartite tricarboxylate transporter substrate binding protein [Reyranellales bacterium]